MEVGELPRDVRTIVRAELSFGAFDAFRAVHFSDRFPPHFHDTFAIGVIESGECRLRTPRGDWLGGSGTILAFSPGEIHSAEPVGESGYTYRMIYPGRAVLEELGVAQDTHDGRVPLFSSPVIQDAALAEQFLSAHAPLMAGDSSSPAQQRLISVLREVATRYRLQTAAGDAPSARDRDAVGRVMQLLTDGFARQIRLSTLAAECGLSAFHLLRVFRDAVGVPPHAYLVQVRVNRALAMLQEGGSVSDVAHACGFADQSHLTRTFKRVVGVPPGQYVRQTSARVAGVVGLRPEDCDSPRVLGGGVSMRSIASSTIGCLIVATACAFPGVRPEGSVLSQTAFAPAPRDSVFNRAESWLVAQGYSIDSRRAGTSLVAHKVVSRDGPQETWSRFAFNIESANADETRFRLEGRTQVGVPPVMNTLDSMQHEASMDMTTLMSRLQCPGARWPRCP